LRGHQELPRALRARWWARRIARWPHTVVDTQIWVDRRARRRGNRRVRRRHFCGPQPRWLCGQPRAPARYLLSAPRPGGPSGGVRESAVDAPRRGIGGYLEGRGGSPHLALLDRTRAAQSNPAVEPGGTREHRATYQLSQQLSHWCARTPSLRGRAVGIPYTKCRIRASGIRYTEIPADGNQVRPACAG
jgi:hypothetical protein